MKIASAAIMLVIGLQASATTLNLGFDTRNGDKRGVKAQIKEASLWLNSVTLYAEEEVNGRIEKVQCAVTPAILQKNGLDMIGFMRLATDARLDAEIQCFGKIDPNSEGVFQALRLNAESVNLKLKTK